MQTKECTIDTIAASSYATIHKDKFENTYIYPEIKNDCLFCVSYIDNIFIIYTGGEAILNNFLTNFDMMHDSIKFDHEKSTHSIENLDKNIQLQTALHSKPGNTHNFLHHRTSRTKYLVADSSSLKPQRQLFLLTCAEMWGVYSLLWYTVCIKKDLALNNLHIQYDNRKPTLQNISTPWQDSLKLTLKVKKNRTPSKQRSTTLSNH